MSAPIHVYRVTGRVQGVGFRWFVREQARLLGLAGKVRNESDGAVQVQVTGIPGAVERLEAALRRGPKGSRVDRVDHREATAAEPLPYPFAIDRSTSPGTGDHDG